MDEPGVDGGKLMEFVAEMDPGRPIPMLFIAPGNLFVGMGTFMRFAIEFVGPRFILVASDKPWGRFEPPGRPPIVEGRAPRLGVAVEGPGPEREGCCGGWDSICVGAGVEP